MAVLAVVAVSARALAEAAARDGFEVVAIDLFGDLDTRSAAAQWLPAGPAGATQLDAEHVLGALRQLSQERGGELIGWIAGTGFDGWPDVLEAGAALLPLIGNTAATVRRVRDPVVFFGLLDALGIAHPPVQWQPPANPAGWLSKDFHASGGWHIRRASSELASQLTGARYFQRQMPGRPMSATFIANGRDAALVGFNELLVRPIGRRPHVYSGCVGPVTVGAAVARVVGDAVQGLVAEFGLRGWCSLDFIADGDAVGVLEINPRPSASMALYAPLGQVEAQLRACLRGELPPPSAFAPARTAGTEIVYADRALRIDAAAASRLAAEAHDLPASGASFSPGEPVCSLRVEADGVPQVKALLSARRHALLNTLETKQ